MKKLKEKFILPAMCTALFTLSLSAGAENIDNEEGVSFLDEVQSFSNYQTTCTKNGVNGAVFTNDLNERKFLSLGQIQAFIDESNGKSQYEETREAFLKIKADFWKTVTKNSMTGRSLPECRL
jgi:hypothetical protein